MVLKRWVLSGWIQISQNVRVSLIQAQPLRFVVAELSQIFIEDFMLAVEPSISALHRLR